MPDLLTDMGSGLLVSALAIAAAAGVVELIAWLVAPLRQQWDKERLR